MCIVIYTSEKCGCDETGTGSEEKPYKTVLRAIFQLKGEMDGPGAIYVDADEDNERGERWATVTPTKYKKCIKLYHIEVRKREKERLVKEAEELSLVVAEGVKITMDPTLPAAKEGKVRDMKDLIGERVKVCGWAHRIRRQGRSLIFIILRDGTGYFQCVLSKDLCRTVDAFKLSTESTIVVYGTVGQVPFGQSAPGGLELQADYWELISLAPAGGIDNVLNTESEVDVQLDNRHLVIRGENTSKILVAVSAIMNAFRDHYRDRKYVELYNREPRTWYGGSGGHADQPLLMASRTIIEWSRLQD